MNRRYCVRGKERIFRPAEVPKNKYDSSVTPRVPARTIYTVLFLISWKRPPGRGQKGSRLHKTQKKLVSSPTTKRLEVFGTMRADFIVCGIGSDVRDFLDNKGAVY
jgi:hypothetical protein